MNLVRRDVKRSGSEDLILICEYGFTFLTCGPHRLENSGGGNVKNRTSDNGAIPSRWMAYEAMLAGLDMKSFRDGIKVKDLEPKIGGLSMKCFYRFLENMPGIKWERHSEGRPPLLEFRLTGQTGREELRTEDDFSRSVSLFSRAHPISEYSRSELAITNVLGRFTTTKSYIHLCACTMTHPKIRNLSHAFPSHGPIILIGQKFSTCFAIKSKI